MGYNIVNGEKKVKIFGEEIAVNARIEYIEGYSGHADQEGLMNFIYSFINKPKQIFLVHGEEEAQDIFKAKVEEEVKIPVVIPQWGETYEFNKDSEEVEVVNKIERREENNTIRREIMQRLSKLRDEIQDMEEYVKQDVNNTNLSDREVFSINERIKDLEKQILNIIEG